MYASIMKMHDACYVWAISLSSGRIPKVENNYEWCDMPRDSMPRPMMLIWMCTWWISLEMLCPD